MKSATLALSLLMSVTTTTQSQADASYPAFPGYRGIWYYNQPSGDEYVYKYSGGLGTYCAKHIPLAVYAPEVHKTFFVYGGTRLEENSLVAMVGYYDHETGMVPRPVRLIDKQTDDAHDNPVLSMDDDGHLWVFVSSHGTSRPSYIFKSREPHDITDWELILETNFSYPQPWYMGERGWIFLHTRYGNGGRQLYWNRSRDWTSWPEGRRLAMIDHGHYQISWQHGNKIGTAFNYHPDGKGLNWRTNLYYVETGSMGRVWRNAAGDEVPADITEIHNPALVHDYEAEGLKVYMKDLNFDANGNPVILHLTSQGYESGPENDPRDWRIAVWTGEAWEFRTITRSDNNYDTGCIHLEDDGTWRVIGPTETGPQPYNPGGEMALWVSTDEGRTWKMERQLTHDSEYNHTYARRPVNAHPDFYALWADGHARQPSESRLYFCNRDGEVFRLPFELEGEMAKPEKVE